MARKGKGAALYELLYRDKGKATFPDGSLKLPTWFRSKGQGPGPQPATAPAPSGQAAAAPVAGPAPAAPTPVKPPEPRSLEPAAAPVSRPAVTAPPKVAEPIAKPATAVIDRPGPLPAGSPPPLARPPAPAGRTPGAVASANRPAVFGPPMSWLRISEGRIRLDLSQFAALMASLGVVCALLVSFILGVYRGHSNQPKDGNTQLANVNPDNGGVDPGITNRPQVNNNANNGNVGQRPVPPPVEPPPADDPYKLVPGKSYVMIQTFDNKPDMANMAGTWLKAKGYDVLVRKQSNTNIYLLRTATGMDKTAAQKLADDLGPVLEQLDREKPGLIRYKPNDPNLKPWVKTLPAGP